MIRFAIIGCGNIGQRHAENIHRKGKLVAVCDVIKQKADELATKYDAKAWYRVDDLLHHEKDIDVVAVCTPNGLHAQHTIQSLQAGAHVLCEKPMALHATDCQRMIDVAKQNNKKLFVVKQNRFNPPVAAVKKALDEGRLGKLYSIQLNCFWNRNRDYYNNPWRGTAALDGGTLYTQFSHFIDLLYWLVGDVKHAQALMANYAHEGIVEFEDTGVVLLEFYNKVIGTVNFTINSYRKNMEGSLMIFGESGTVKIGGQYLNKLEYQNIEGFHITDIPDGNSANQYGTYQGSMSNHDKVYDNVINVLHHNGDVTAPAEDGLKTVEIIEKIYQAAVYI